MKRQLMLTALIVGVLAGTGALAQRSAAAKGTVEVYKSPTCGCCAKWVEHLQTNGFTVRTTNVPDEQLAELKTKHKVPGRARSCHTALVGGYVVEGHVPAADVRRLLDERPDVRGIAVPGMPIGSPGMEVPGVAAQRYDVLAFDDKEMRVFARH